MSLIDKACVFATRLHNGQYRKYSKLPYIYHPSAVAHYLEEKSYKDENLISAGYLHDVVEDCNVSYNTLEKEFNRTVKQLVWEVSHPEIPVGLKRHDRWQVYLQHYEIASDEGKVLKLADRICNLQEYIDFWEQVDGKGRWFVQNVYLEESNELLESIGNVDSSMRQDLLHVINYLDELCSED